MSDFAVARPAMIVCLTVNALVLMYVAVERPEYLADYRLNPNPDARHYVLLGENLLTTGHFSRCSSPPFVPDILRTPAYPVFAGALNILGGPLAIYLVQALLGTISCLLVVKLARPQFGDRAARWASILFAGDLLLAISNFEAMSEPLYLFLTLAAIVCLIPVITAARNSPRYLGRVASGGALLAAATLTRPAGFYLPVVVVCLLVLRGLYTRAAMRAVLQSAVLVFATGMPVGAWVARNAITFSVPHLTNADAIMIVYFAGAGAYQVERGLTLEQAQEQIEMEYALPSPRMTNNHWISPQSVAEMDSALRAVKRDILAKYPRSLVISSLLGAMKATVSHNLAFLAAASGSEWHAPRIASLLRGELASFDRLRENPAPLAVAFIWQMLYLIPAVPLAALGLFIALRDPSNRWTGFALVGILAYFYLTVAVVGVEAYYRSRIPHMPYIYAFAGLALAKALPRPRDNSNLDSTARRRQVITSCSMAPPRGEN